MIFLLTQQSVESRSLQRTLSKGNHYSKSAFYLAGWNESLQKESTLIHDVIKKSRHKNTSFQLKNRHLDGKFYVSLCYSVVFVCFSRGQFLCWDQRSTVEHQALLSTENVNTYNTSCGQWKAGWSSTRLEYDWCLQKIGVKSSDCKFSEHSPRTLIETLFRIRNVGKETVALVLSQLLAIRSVLVLEKFLLHQDWNL